jgi:hypothetical protein
MLAAVARSVYLLSALQHLGAEALVTSLPDTRVYLAMGEHILSGPDAIGKEFLFWVGPGYGLIVAGIKSVFGSNNLFLSWFNVLLGSVGTVMIYLLAYHLTDSKAVAFLAGLIAALSSTSLVMSSNIMTDQPYYTFHASALLCFTVGIKRLKMGWFVVAGLLAGYAAYIRALGQLWPPVYLLIPLVLFQGDPLLRYRGFPRIRMMKMSAITAGLAALMILGWAARNWTVEGVFVFGGNGAIAARSYVASRAIADHTSNLNVHDVRRRFNEEDVAHFGDTEPSVAEKYHYWKDQFIQIARAHPQWLAVAFWRNAVDNIKGGNYIAKSQVPAFSKMWWWLIAANRAWLSYLIVVVSVLGLVLLLLERRSFAAVLLGFTFVYFSLIIGFSAWQGSRLHYPAEIGWSILVAFAVVRIVTLIVRLSAQIRLFLPKTAETLRSRWRTRHSQA